MTKSLEATIKQMQSGEIYDPNDAELLEYQMTKVQLANEFNRLGSSPEEMKKRSELMKKMLASCGEGCYIEPPFRANWGGHFMRFGNHVYANFNLTVVDDSPIIIDDCVMIGANVTIATACHPISPALRRYGMQYNKPVHIKEGVWIGSCVTVLPGVTIGKNSVIGAGSIVTKDIPDNVVAMGNPCRVRRDITVEDYLTYDHGKPVPREMLEKYDKEHA